MPAHARLVVRGWTELLADVDHNALRLNLGHEAMDLALRAIAWYAEQQNKAALAAYNGPNSRAPRMMKASGETRLRHTSRRYRTTNPTDEQDRSLYPLVESLFPEVWEHLSALETEEKEPSP